MPARRRRAAFRVLACLVLLSLLAACGKKEETAAPAAAGAPAAGQAAAPPPAVADAVAAMGVDQLREAASKALREQRLYSPAGDNAMEYYLALRDKLPDDAAVSSALTDLMPYTLIATEQSIGREDFTEAQRLYALLEKTDPQAPALPRLKESIASGQKAVAQRAEQDKLKSEAEAKRQADLEKQRQQQAQAAQELAAKQEEARRAEAQRAAAQQAAQRTETAPAATAPKPVAPAPAPKKPTAADLVSVSTPAPQFPVEAYRAGTSGEVQVEFTVGPDGSVTSAKVVRSNPRRTFDQAALDAVRRWRFQPIGAPVTTRRTIAFNPGG